MYNSQLDTFIQVADEGSFSKAAQNMFISPTAVIKQINRLEGELGLKLFDRNENVIRIGTSIMTPSQFLIELWPKIEKECPTHKFQLVSFENTPENARAILANFGQHIDLVAGLFDENYSKCG